MICNSSTILKNDVFIYFLARVSVVENISFYITIITQKFFNFMRFFHDKSDLRGSNSDGTLHLSTDSDFFNMPKKKTGQRKKAEKQRERQKELRNAEKSLAQQPSNFLMVCEYVNVSYMCLFRISSYIVHVVYIVF